MFGQGLIKGLQITWKEMLAKKVTVQYPEERIPMAKRFHGRFVFHEDRCIVCGLCANACPNKVIEFERVKVGKKQYLTKYVMRIEYCMFCGLCVEACPKEAITFSDVIEMNQYLRRAVRLVMIDRPAPPPEALAEAEAAAGDDKAEKAARAPSKPAQSPDREG